MAALRAASAFSLVEAPGPTRPRALAYFLCEQKVGKKSLKGSALENPVITGEFCFAPEAQITGLN